ncbi:hypothetical protein HELRODRAFT_185909 [Helobdella robusta]|uniref:Major facilitator superfamily (MFS) profile domain-containing protein n=1 Tax=Helobdella robusta TaxID=6412 RepID=T1FNF6_HELRO|nr:hypothetical protein HELRODRAFT_185909 [Helobdella robusta]ESN97614.1 hypothetical protein HELRODRAFT_185909 [Helobdella robusta]
MDSSGMKVQTDLQAMASRKDWTWSTALLGFFIAFSTSFQYGYNLSVLNQPMALVKQFLNDSLSAQSSTSASNFTLLTISSTTSLPEASTPTSPPPSSSTSLPAQNSISENTLTILWSLCTAVFVCGGMIGSFVVSWLADRLGRKVCVMLIAGPSVFGGVLSFACVYAASPALLLVGRFITGLSCGAATQLGPMYMLEIVPINLKGAMGVTYQLFVSIGLAMSSILGLSSLLGAKGRWSVLMLMNVVPSVVSLISFPFLPESPRFLLMAKEDKTRAKQALQWLRRNDDVVKEMEEMEEESRSQGRNESFTLVKMFKTRELLIPLVICTVLQLMQQFSGINAIFFYSTGIYLNAGVAVDVVQYANLGTCFVSVAMNFTVIPLMDRLGRRMLLLGPISGMVLTLVVITIALNLQPRYHWLSYLSIVCVISYVVLFSCGLGPIPNMITAEVFTQGPRAKAMSLTGLINWLSNAVVAMCFEIVQAATKEFVFLIFMTIMVASLIFTYFNVPETKNKTFDEIANQFKKHTEENSNNEHETVIV